TLLITGKLDGRLTFSRDDSAVPGTRRLRPLFEVKEGMTFHNLRELADFERSPWTRHAPDQLLAYMYAEGEPWGLFVLPRPGLPRLIPVSLEANLERIKATLRRVRQAVDAAKGEAPLPDFTTEKSDCRRCPHLGRSCAPPMDFSPGAQLFTDEHDIQLAERRDELEAARKEWQRADEHLKEKYRGVDIGFLGPFELRGRWKAGQVLADPTKKAELDKELKAVKSKFMKPTDKGS